MIIMMKFNYFKNKRIPYLRKYSYICFAILMVLFVYFRNYKIDNDSWFLINHGRYVFHHGIPYIEPFTIHNGFSFVMQQWLTSLIFYLFYCFFGIKSLFILCVLINYLFVYICYKLCMCLSDNNYKISFIVSICIDLALIFFNFIVVRPQIFTYCLMMLMFFSLESYIKKKNEKYLLLLPVISFFQINLHASMWWLLYVFMLPYLFDGYKFKLFNREQYKKRPIIVSMIAMFITALINPYGISAILYFFNSYGIKEINYFVAEMKAIKFEGILGLFIFVDMMVVFLCYILAKNNKMRVRFMLLLFGSLYLGLTSYKGISYFCMLSFFPVAFFFKDSLKIIKSREIYSNDYKKVYGFLIIILLLSFGFYFYCNGLDYTNKLEKGIDYLLDNYDRESIKLYVGYDQGGYCEFRGIKTYLDQKAEVFLKANNKKEDIFKEYYNLISRRKDMNKFLSKYKFTHLLIVKSEGLYNEMKKVDDYDVIYKGKISHKESYRIYVRKDLEKGKG